MPKTKVEREALVSAAEIAADTVEVRITKLGDGKVSTGEHRTAQGDMLYETGEIAILPRVVALDLEERGFAEIQVPKGG